MNLKLIKFGLIAAATGLACSAQAAEQTRVIRGADVQGEVVYPARVTVDMSALEKPRQWQPGDPIREIPLRNNNARNWRHEAEPRGFGVDPLAQRQQLVNDQFGGDSRAFGDTPVNVDGTGFTGVNPSDTVGDIGRDYYVQVINNNTSSAVLIIDKTDGTTVSSFILDALAAGSGTGCGGGRGDPVVNFDELGDGGNGQWLLTEFTSTSFCAYVSETSDPTTGNWFVYEFASFSGGLPDYPKFGVWSDAYYIGANEGGPRVYAIDRVNMLNGDPARPTQIFLASNLPGYGNPGFQHLMPVDADGTTPPPAGAPGIFMRHRDDEFHDGAGAVPGQDILEIWEFAVDWDTPANSTFTGPVNIITQEFDTNLGGTAFAALSVPQQDGATNLFPLKQPLMWRVQHRTIGGVQHMVGNLVTDVDGNDYHGVRWFQLTRPGATTTGGWTLADEGTYTDFDDGVHRWMASAALDEDGNLVIGYNVSNDVDTYAGMRYAGRLAGDPAGTLPRGEHIIVSGTASNSSNRYGDYTSLNVDPVDGCTFWYTAQYNTSGNWSTRIGSFRFDECGDPGFSLSSSESQHEVCVAAGPDSFSADLNIGSLQNFSNPVTLAFNPALPAGFSDSYTVNPVTPGSTTTVTVDIADTVAGGDYPLTLEGTATGAADRQVSFDVSVFDAVPGALNLTAPANGAVDVPGSGVVFTWDAASGAQSYLFELATDAGFTNIIESATVDTNGHVSAQSLDPETEYFWRVTASNICGDSATQSASFTTALIVCSTPAQVIPDSPAAGVNDSIVIPPGFGNVTAVNVSLRVTHGWPGDLKFTLSKAATSAVLMDQPGVPATQFGCGTDHIDATFTDASAVPVETECAASPPGIGGALQPEEPLSVFNGQSFSGEWVLFSEDLASGIVPATLDEWCLEPALAEVVDLIYANSFD